MLDHAKEAVALAAGAERGGMDRLRNLALAHLIEIIGEAANRTPKDFQSRHPEIPWTDATGMRNKLAHGYDLVDYGIVWDTAHRELPALVAKLERLMRSKGQA
ncbi:MAG TPA: HepT-like ribonuclease domain-containing protein [Candidatus Thermoplasmatota archaeon]|nr:HepT-like ribonuclease domain-containing protein [Candidatus Thermoplasmatota archaeon]